MKIEPIILEGAGIRLEPLSLEHIADLSEIAFDESIWRWTLGKISNETELRDYIKVALEELKRGLSLPFATVEKSSGKAIGSTRFGEIAVEDKRVEIGWTWIAAQFQRTFVNTEAKYLMLKHAFEIWQCHRVQLETDFLNEKSRNAIWRIGAKEEGILRRHRIHHSGRVRDTVMFSIIDAEWQEVKTNLEAKLAQ
jgi:N-acetyltransferase